MPFSACWTSPTNFLVRSPSEQSYLQTWGGREGYPFHKPLACALCASTLLGSLGNFIIKFRALVMEGTAALHLLDPAPPVAAPASAGACWRVLPFFPRPPSAGESMTTCRLHHHESLVFTS